MTVKRCMRRFAAIVAVSGLVASIAMPIGVVGASHQTVSVGHASIAPQQTETSPVTNQTASITFLNQTTNGTAVVIERVVLPAGGYIVIHNESGAVIGTTDTYLEPGVHQNVTVPLGGPIEERIAFDAPLEGNQTLVAIAHRDSDDDFREVLEFFRSNGSVDYPYFVNGEIVSDSAFVSVAMGTADDDQPATTTSTDASENETTQTQSPS